MTLLGKTLLDFCQFGGINIRQPQLHAPCCESLSHAQANTCGCTCDEGNLVIIRTNGGFSLGLYLSNAGNRACHWCGAGCFFLSL